MKRRTFLLGIPAALLFARARHPESIRNRAEAAALDEATLDELAAAVASDRRLHRRLGSRAVHGLVVEHVSLATDLLRGSPPAALRPRLAAIAGEAANLAGHVYFDQRQLAAAQSYKALAAELAREAGDPLLEAYSLGSWSRKLAESGDVARALSFVDNARTVAAQRPSLTTLGYLAMTEAEAQASMGDADASLRTLDRADEALGRGDQGESSPWLDWLEGAQVDGWKGRCLTRLGRLDDADALLDKALSTWDPSFVRDRAITLVDLASLRLRQEELEECCRLTAASLELALSTSSSRVVQQVRDLRLELEPWKESAPVRALDEQMVAASWV